MTGASHTAHLKYRADIDGLRAIAVLSVIGYHAFPAKIAGGFVGVDIFFVISGYLISTIVFSNLERDSFSIVDFYNRRIRRIFPALITVIAASWVFGWFALFADEYAQLGKHIAAGASFLSNFTLYSESGYFDSAADTKPLLHLWSLAIEEQFYIFWPLMLAFVWKRKWSFLRITVLIAALSFATNFYLIRSDPTAAFYWPISRFWELMIGGTLAYVTLHRPELIQKYKNAQSIVGFGLLAIGLAMITKEREFPGWWALLPTVGSFFIISAGSSAWLNKNVLSLKPVVWFGLISYPLYLWHWVLLAFGRVIEINPTREMKLALVLSSILLAWATYSFIEKPIRFRRAKSISGRLALGLLSIGVIGFVTLKTGGLEGSDAEKSSYVSYFDNSLPQWKYFEREDIPAKYNFQCDFYDVERYKQGRPTKTPVKSLPNSCYLRNSQFEKAVFIWGDSHAQQFYFGLKQQLPENWQILQVSSSGCAPKLNAVASGTDYCEYSNWFAYNAIANARPDFVLVAQNSDHSMENMLAIADRLKEAGVKHVVFAGPDPHWVSTLPKVILRSLWNNTPHRTFVGLIKMSSRLTAT